MVLMECEKEEETNNGMGKIIGLPNSGTLYQQSVRKVDASYITKLQSVFRGKIRTSDISSESSKYDACTCTF